MNPSADGQTPRRAAILVAIAYAVAFLLISALTDSRGLEKLTGDSATYLAPAASLVAGHGYSVPLPDGSYSPYAHRTPGYAGFLAIPVFFLNEHAVTAAVWIQRIIIVSLMSGLIWLLGSRATGIFRFVLPACLIVIGLHPAIIVSSSQILSESIYFSLTVTAMILLLNSIDKSAPAGKQVALAGLLLGAAALVRPVGIIVIASLILFAAFQMIAKRDYPIVKKIAIAFIVALVPCTLWMMRNLLLFGAFGFSPLSGYNGLIHRESVIARLDASQMPKHESFLTQRLQSGSAVVDALSDLELEENLSRFQVDAAAKNLTRMAIKKDPVNYAVSSLKNCVILLTSPSDWFELAFPSHELNGDRKSVGLRQALNERDYGLLCLHLLARFANFTVLALMPAGLAYACRRKLGRGGAAVVWICYTMLILGTAVSIPTFGRLSVPLLAMLVAMIWTCGKLSDAPQSKETAEAVSEKATGTLAA